MFLYKLELTLEEHEAILVVLAETDEQAFQFAEGLLLKHYIKIPQIKELAIVEKKRTDKGSGFVIETTQSGRL